MNTCHKQTLEKLKSEFSSRYDDCLDRMCLLGYHAVGKADAGSGLEILVLLKGNVDPNKERRKTLDIVRIAWPNYQSLHRWKYDTDG